MGGNLTLIKGPMGIGPFIVHRKGQPRLRLAFPDRCLLAEQRFDIQPLRLQDFAQTAQAFTLNRTRSRVRPISRPTSSSVAASYPSKPNRRASTSRCLAFSSNSHLTMLCFISSSCVVSSDRSLFHRRGCPATLFRNHHPAGCPTESNALVKTKYG